VADNSLTGEDDFLHQPIVVAAIVPDSRSRWIGCVIARIGLLPAFGSDRQSPAVGGSQAHPVCLSGTGHLHVKRHPLLVLWRHENWST
jgi:hypothetical protein